MEQYSVDICDCGGTIVYCKYCQLRLCIYKTHSFTYFRWDEEKDCQIQLDIKHHCWNEKCWDAHHNEIMESEDYIYSIQYDELHICDSNNSK